MWERYGKIILPILTFFVGAIIIWGLYGFTMPTAFSGEASIPKEGDDCKTADNKAGTVQADGSCKA